MAFGFVTDSKNSDDAVVLERPDDKPKSAIIGTLPAKKNARGKKRHLGSDALEMLKIRKSLGMSQPDFAVALEVSRDKIINIENGRLVNIDKTLLQAARDMLHSEHSNRVEPLMELESMDIKDILERWKGMVGAISDNEAAILLGTTITTIERWRNGGSRPSPESLLRYEIAAKRIQKRIQAAGL